MSSKQPSTNKQNNDEVTLSTGATTLFSMIVYITSGIVTLTLFLAWIYRSKIQLVRLMTTTETIISNEDDATEQWISVISAFALLLTTWFGLFSYLRGFEDFAWIIMTLQRITVSFRYFLMVVLLVIISFEMAFQALYRGADEDLLVVQSNEVDGNEHDLVAYMNIAIPFANVPTSLLRTFMAGILGDVDTDEFWKTHSIIISQLYCCFSCFSLC